MKRFLALFSALCLVLCLASCKKGGNDGNTAETVSQTERTDTKSAPEKKTAKASEGDIIGLWDFEAAIGGAIAARVPGFVTYVSLDGRAEIGDGKIILSFDPKAVDSALDTLKAEITNYFSGDEFLKAAAEQEGVNVEDISAEALDEIAEKLAGLPDKIIGELKAVIDENGMTNTYDYSEKDGVLTITKGSDKAVDYTYSVTEGKLKFMVVSDNDYYQLESIEFFAAEEQPETETTEESVTYGGQTGTGTAGAEEEPVSAEESAAPGEEGVTEETPSVEEEVSEEEPYPTEEPQEAEENTSAVSDTNS